MGNGKMTGVLPTDVLIGWLREHADRENSDWLSLCADRLATLTRERAEWEQIARGHFADLQEARDELEQMREQVEEVARQFDKLVASSVTLSVPARTTEAR